MSKVLIIHTGGTIGMTRTENGYQPDGKAFRKALAEMDILRSEDLPEWEMTETLPLLDSSRMKAAEWNRIGGLIAEKYAEYDGFVILHGTDTMAYTASALSFMLKDLNKPVILTGSQIPLIELRSDGRDNLITSLVIAGSGKVREVCIYFGGTLLRGNRAMKYSADGMRAFVSPNYPPLAEAGIFIQYNEALLQLQHRNSFEYRPFADVPVGVLKVFPGIRYDLFAPVLTGDLKGLVIETFGTGNIPDEGDVLFPVLADAVRKGIVLVVCSQCPQATVDINVYETAASLRKAGAISGRDMTTEAAVTKLYYLFSVCSDADEVRNAMERNLRGEMTE